MTDGPRVPPEGQKYYAGVGPRGGGGYDPSAQDQPSSPCGVSFVTEQREQRREPDLREALARETAAHAETRRRLSELALQLGLTEARERRAIAEDLHDHVGQALAVMKIRLETFRGNAIFSGSNAEIGEMLRLLDQTITYTRDLTGTISPPVLFELGLEEALDWLAERMETTQGLQVAFRVNGSALDLRDEQKIMVFRSAQELLRNVVVHAGCDSATMTLTWRPDGLELAVADRGCGFDAEKADLRTEAFGLFSIRERMRQLGGGVDVETEPGRGTRVRLDLPLDRPQGDQS